MPLYRVRTDHFHGAFIMSALVSGFVAVSTVFLKDEFQRLHDPNSVDDSRMQAWLVVATVASAVVGSLVIFYLFHWLFGFGGGMLARSEEEAKNHEFITALRLNVTMPRDTDDEEEEAGQRSNTHGDAADAA